MYTSRIYVKTIYLRSGCENKQILIYRILQAIAIPAAVC